MRAWDVSTGQHLANSKSAINPKVSQAASLFPEEYASTDRKINQARFTAGLGLSQNLS